MLESLETHDALYNGLIPTHAPRASGMNSNAVDALLRRGELVRVRRGWFALGATWEAVGADGRYRFFVRATAMQAGSHLMLSHHSAAALHDLPLIGAWPRTVHALHAEAAGGSSQRLLLQRIVRRPTLTQLSLMEFP